MTKPGSRFRLHVLGIALFTVLAAAVFLYFVGLSGVELLPRDTYTLHATAADAVQMSDHADVLEAGVKVGSVTAISLDHGTAALTLTLDRRYGPVYEDGQIAIREKTLLGENYVDLDPGDPSSGAIPNGGALPGTAPAPVELDQILSTFDAAHRRDFQRILAQLGGGLAGQGTQLNALLGGSAQLVANAAPVTSVLAADRDQVASLIADFGSVSASLGQRATAIRTLVRASLVTGRAVAARDTALRAVLREAPAFIAQASRTIRHLGRFSTGATPVVAELRQAVAALVPAVTELRPAATEARTVFADLDPFAVAGTAAAAALRRSAPVLTTLAGPLESLLRQSDPMMAYLERYTLDVGPLFSSLDGSGHYQDASSGYGRAQANFTRGLISGLGAGGDELGTLEQTGLVSSTLDRVQSNPYPAPGTAGHRVAYSGTYPHVEADPPYRLH